MEESILQLLNRSYRNFQFNPNACGPLTEVPFDSQKTGKKRKRKKEYEEWYEYHDSIHQEVEEYHRRYLKKRKLDHNGDPFIDKFPEIGEIDNENFDDYIQVSKSFSIDGESSFNLEEVDDGMEVEEMDLVNKYVSNTTEKSISSFDGDFVIPSDCGFVLGSIADFTKFVPEKNKYDIIVLDPNWSNKSARRNDTYHVAHHDLKSTLKGLPLPKLGSVEGTIILMWCTNRIHYHKFIEKELIPHWNENWNDFEVKLVKKMIWIKVARNQELIFSLDCDRRKPYEHLYILHSQAKMSTSKSKFSFRNVERVFREGEKCFVNMPTIQHSQKPPLFDWIVNLVGGSKRTSEKCLELYARNLYSGVDSVGNEVLKFQNRKYFVKK